MPQLVGVDHRGHRLDLAALGNVESEDADQPLGRVEHHRPGLPVHCDLAQRGAAEAGSGGPHSRQQRADHPHPAFERLGQAAAMQGHVVGQQLLERAEVAVLGGGEEPPGQALALLARRLEAGSSLPDVPPGPGHELAAFCSLVATIAAIWS
jgi:hypothetical protein